MSAISGNTYVFPKIEAGANLPVFSFKTGSGAKILEEYTVAGHLANPGETQTMYTRLKGHFFTFSTEAQVTVKKAEDGHSHKISVLAPSVHSSGQDRISMASG